MPRLLVVALLVLAAASAHAQSLPAEARAVLGDWTTYGDEGREAQAVIRLTADGGELRGQIVRLLPTQRHPTPTFRCGDCEDRYEGVDLRTVPLFEGMRWQGDEFAGGRIVDPTNAKTYRAVVRLDGPDRLEVRGFIGIRALGRTQVWRRAH
ncbi:DUF2147 domain-containing protein [Rubrivirga marina]|uniref:DUF2147 domain-containing protein n=1 Tax=Rubrivirga marina TaxID=1196024 RepID=A0A271J3X2_9BACT|nr:DUF2147 domain-containing protein [Rubrivirga marina]PAP78202.1 hypothetical protein BSZ37_18095 [Rubrivirga marina]